MDTKSLLYGIAGLMLGGLIVSVAALYETPKKSSMSDVTMTQMRESLADKKGDEYDKAFLDHMIAHHQGAIDIAKLSAKNAKHDEVKQLSKDIISAQEKEINDMRQWQVQWGYAMNNRQMSH